MANQCIAEQPETVLFLLIGRRREPTQGPAIGKGPGQLDRAHELPAGLERTGESQRWRRIHGSDQG